MLEELRLERGNGAAMLDCARSLACLFLLALQSSSRGEQDIDHPKPGSGCKLQISEGREGGGEGSKRGKRKRRKEGHVTKPNQVWFKPIEKLNLHLED